MPAKTNHLQRQQQDHAKARGRRAKEKGKRPATGREQRRREDANQEKRQQRQVRRQTNANQKEIERLTFLARLKLHRLLRARSFQLQDLELNEQIQVEAEGKWLRDVAELTRRLMSTANQLVKEVKRAERRSTSNPRNMDPRIEIADTDYWKLFEEFGATVTELGVKRRGVLN